MNYDIDPHIERAYRIDKYVGGGAYGVVWRAADRRTGAPIALKKVFDAFGNATDAQRTYREVALLTGIEHANIVPLLRVMRSVDGRDLYLAFPLAECDVHTVVKAGLLRDAHRQYMCYQLVRAVWYLHRRGIIHRDLKPANILVDTNCVIQLADFGLARSCDGPRHTVVAEEGPRGDLTDYIATRWYRAPELLVATAQYDASIDMWAVGCIIAELFLGVPLFRGASTTDQMRLIIAAIGAPADDEIAEWRAADAAAFVSQLRPPATSGTGSDALVEQLRALPRDAAELARLLLCHSPSRRLSAAEAMRHPFIAVFATPDELASDGDLPPLRPLLDDHVRHTVEEYRAATYALCA